MSDAAKSFACSIIGLGTTAWIVAQGWWTGWALLSSFVAGMNLAYASRSLAEPRREL